MRRKRYPFLAAIYAASVHVGKAGGARVHNGYPREFFHPIFMGSLALRKGGGAPSDSARHPAIVRRLARP